jgi:hypothetical protein
LRTGFACQQKQQRQKLDNNFIHVFSKIGEFLGASTKFRLPVFKWIHDDLAAKSLP